MGQIDTYEQVLERVMKNWLAWQSSAVSYRLSLTTPVVSEFVQIDQDEAQRTERAMLKLKAINAKVFDAVVVYYQSHASESLECVAEKLKIGKTEFRARLDKGKHFLYGSINRELFS